MRQLPENVKSNTNPKRERRQTKYQFCPRSLRVGVILTAFFAKGIELMQRVKLFKSIETEIDSLEKDINDWLKRSGAKVISLTGNIAPQSVKPDGGGGLGKGSFSPSDVLVVVLYEAAD